MIKKRRPDPTPTSLGALFLLCSGIYLLLYIVIFVVRANYPFELEWCEGQAVDVVQRLLSGQPYYTRPSLDYLPNMYPPLYSSLAAGLSLIAGQGFLPLRLVSFLASLGCLGLIYLLVKRETGSAAAGMTGAGIYIAAFRACGAWYDLARVDSLFLCLALAALFVLRSSPTSRGWALAGVLAFLAFFTKQTALVIFIPMAGYCLYTARRRGVWFVATVGLLVMGSTLLMDGLSGGWYSYWVFKLPASHPMLHRLHLSYWLWDIGGAMGVCVLLAGAWFWRQYTEKKYDRLSFYAALLAGALAGSWITRVHPGGYDNVLMSAYAALAIMAGLAVGELALGKEQFHWWGISSRIIVALLCLLQFSSFAYHPLKQLPSQRDRIAGESMIKVLRGISGRILMPYHGYLPVLAGKQSSAHIMVALDVLRAGKEYGSEELLADIRAAIAEKRYAAIIADSGDFGRLPFRADIERHYRRAGALFKDPELFWPVTGFRTRPEFVYLPR
jgi:hypothetical protein